MNSGTVTGGANPFRRLVPYLRRDTARLAIGIIAGALAGTSIFGLLKLTAEVLNFLSPAGSASIETVAQPVPVPESDDMLMKVAGLAGIPPEQLGKQLTRRFVLVLVLLLPAMIIVRNLFVYLNGYCLRSAAQRVVRDLRNDLFEKLQSQSLAFFGRSNVGNLISRSTNDTTIIEQTVAGTTSDIARAPFEIASALAFAFYFAVKCQILFFMLKMMLAIPLCIVPVILLGRVVRKNARRALERISDLVTRMHETFTGVRVVKAFYMEKAETDRFKEVNGKYFKSVLRSMRAELLMSPLMEVVAAITICVVLLAGFAREIRLAELVPFVVAAVWAYQPMKKIAAINAGIQRGGAALERVFELMDVDTALREAANPVVLGDFKDRIVYEDVSFDYGQGGRAVLEDIRLEIPRGHVVAVVGQTGSGKTTMAGLLARFYDPVRGRVTIDGHDLRDVQIASLRKLIGVVTQDTILFNDTISGNIAYGTPGATRAQIEDAAKRANAHEFIMASPGGYDRLAGEKGFVLSGGEKQRIAIARAILRNSPILILDEATSALDTVTERLVQEAISHVMENRTVFAIAHRLSTIRHADLILLIDQGRIVERGTHEELHRAGGMYRKLCDMQVVGD